MPGSKLTEKIRKQAQQDKNTKGSFYGQDRAAQFDPQARVDFERKVSKKKYKGGVVLPKKRKK